MRTKGFVGVLSVCLGLTIGFSACGNKKKVDVAENDSIVNVKEETGKEKENVKLIPNEALNDAARFVAGMPVRNTNSKLYALTQTREWKNHSRNMDQIWNSYQQNVPKIASFSLNELADLRENCHTLFYPFGGPDFLFSNAFFPDMDTYFLIGLENPGSVIRVNHPSAKTYKQYQDAVSDVLSLSFFRTKEMNVEVTNDTIDGVIPIISMLMARSDKEIISIENRRINNNGDIVADNEDGSPITRPTGLIEIKFFRKGHARLQTLYYMFTDLSNTELQKNKSLLAYINKLNRRTNATLIKSASYLMHGNSFSMIRELILTHSAAIMQDDSGIPLSFYSPEKWNISLYGTFYKPIATYAAYAQPELRDAYQLGNPKPLNFRVGFSRQSNLQVMRRK